jgi:predicted nuclease of predicted toxin-antitoxin system
MKILVDMNLSPAWAEFLTEAGFQAMHWSTVGSPDASDVELMRWAAVNGHILMTADLDFGAILAATQGTAPSVLQVRSDVLTTRAIGAAVIAALHQTQEDLLAGALISVDASRSRLRILPLK